jgi:hypothetical protein
MGDGDEAVPSAPPVVAEAGDVCPLFTSSICVQIFPVFCFSQYAYTVNSPRACFHRTYTTYLFFCVYTLCMKLDPPNPNTPVSPSTSQLAFVRIYPQYTIYAPWSSILDSNVAHWFLHTPDVHVCVQGSGSAVLVVVSPRKRIYAGRVKGPPRRYCL